MSEADLAGVGTSQDLAGHDAGDGDDANYVHLVQDGHQRQLDAAAPGRVGGLPPVRPQRQQLLYSVLAWVFETTVGIILGVLLTSEPP